jgi:hypothetical protein
MSLMIASFVFDHREQVLLIEDQRPRLLVAAVQNGRDLSFVTQAAARTFALHLAEVRADGECNFHRVSFETLRYETRPGATTGT